MQSDSTCPPVASAVPAASASVRLDRHARHVLLKEIGGAGQARLAAAHVAIVGLGGLGAPAALYLAAAGVGRLTLIDPDRVELSNLQRQILYDTGDVGAPKAEVAAGRLARLDPDLDLRPLRARLDTANAEACLAGASLVLDGTDSFAARAAINAACHTLGVPLVSGAVGRWTGHVGVFASGPTRGAPAGERAPCWRCFAPDPVAADGAACSELGVVGALTGLIGAAMAMEAIKLVTGAGDSLTGRLLVWDGLAAQARTLRLARDPACPCCGDST